MVIKIEMLNIGTCYPNLLEKVDQSIALHWVVFPQVDQNRNAKYWDVLPQLIEK